MAETEIWGFVQPYAEKEENERENAQQESGRLLPSAAFHESDPVL